MRKHQLLTLLCLSIVYIVWGSTFFGVKMALQGGLSPFFMIGLRFFLAGAALYGLSRWRGQAAASVSDWREAALLGFLLLVCGAGLVAWSEQWVSSSLAALLVATSPLWVTLMDREQRLTRRKWLGLLLGLAGVGSLVGASMSFDGPGFLWGCLGCLASAVAWAIGSLRARRPAAALQALPRAGMQMICAGLMLLAAAFLLEDLSALKAVGAHAWMALGYLTLFGSLVAFSAYTWLVGNASAAMVSTHAYVNPVVAVLLGSLLGGETLAGQTVLAATVAMLGVVLLMLPEPASPRPVLAVLSPPRSLPRRPRPRRQRRRARLRAC
jgi:drug/metabolite transporter (DMT)-like permease